MKKLVIYYDFIVTCLIVLAAFVDASSPLEALRALPLLPLAIYFGLFVLPRQQKAIILPVKKVKPAVSTTPEETAPTSSEEEIPATPIEGEIAESEGIDSNRRMFLKLIGSAGLSVFFFALFTKKAEAAFFGSAPGPGTVALKNIAGEKINPAEKQPTDGYNITKIDDSSSPVYYGFVNKDGAWFIMQEGDGTYLYTKGSSDFSGNWSNRASLEYDYFDKVF